MNAVEEYFLKSIAIYDAKITLDDLRKDTFRKILEKPTIRPQALYILEEIAEVLEPVKGKAILDVGCGVGYFSFLLAEAGAYTIGVESNPALIAVAEGIKTMKSLHCSFQKMPIESYLTINPRTFDATLMLNVFDQMLRRDEKQAWDSLQKIRQRSKYVFMMTGATEQLPNTAGIRTAFPLDIPLKPQLESDEYGYEMVMRKGGFKNFEVLLRNSYGQRELWLFR